MKHEDMSDLPQLEELPWAEWMEEGLRSLMKLEPESIALCAVLADGEIFTGYFNCSCMDKIQISGNIHMDATMDMLEANGGKLAEIMSAEDDFAAWDEQFEDSGE